ncbi:MAG: tRNA pseudouridine(38-40) synthase TruA [Bdellovibrionales bacterium]|nr:tRNA pseudouridine(38-40) synthase TruA [Bdellovibrionales bacterium]
MEKGKKRLKSAAEKRTFRLVIAYRGTVYQGWQKQAREGGGPTVQELIEKAVKKITGGKASPHASGRTDAGVHARAQVAHLRVATHLEPERLLKAINAHLPDDIRLLSLEEASPDFHAQLHASAKTYRYFILHAPESQHVNWPFLRNFTWFVTFPLDLGAMQEAARALEGRHDFQSFRNRGTPVPHTIREIHRCVVIEHPLGSARDFPWMPGPGYEARLLEIRVEGSGFLKQMVRTIAGTLVEIGRGKRTASDMGRILSEKNRKAGGITAPPQGLFLDEVSYSKLR